MARDEELRKVAEDVKALARSLAKDLREAVDQSRQGGHSAGEAVRHSVKNVADQVSRDIRAEFGRGPWGYRRHGHHPFCWWGPPRSRWVPPATPPPPGATGPSTGDPAGGAPSQWSAPPWGPGRPGRHHHPHRVKLPPVRRRWDASTVIGMLAVLFGVAWLLGAVTSLRVSLEAVVALGLMLLGASLIITGRTDWSLSRRSWPVWVGVGFIAVLIATSSTFGIGSALSNLSFGNKNATATATASGQTIHGGFGDLTVDATNLQGGSHLKIVSAAGQVLVTNLPPNVPVHVDARVAAGEICVNGRRLGDGVEPVVHWDSSATPLQPSDEITLDVHELFGQIVIGKPGCAR